MKYEIILKIDHPIFGDNCNVELECEAIYQDPDYEDGRQVSEGYYEIQTTKIKSVNDKIYSSIVDKSITAFIFNNYENLLQEEIGKYCAD